MKYTSQHCCDQTVDGKMAWCRECCCPNFTKSWWKELLLQVLGRDHPNHLALDPPLCRPLSLTRVLWVSRATQTESAVSTLSNRRMQDSVAAVCHGERKQEAQSDAVFYSLIFWGLPKALHTLQTNTGLIKGKQPNTVFIFWKDVAAGRLIELLQLFPLA